MRARYQLSRLFMAVLHQQFSSHHRASENHVLYFKIIIIPVNTCICIHKIVFCWPWVNSKSIRTIVVWFLFLTIGYAEENVLRLKSIIHINRVIINIKRQLYFAPLPSILTPDRPSAAGLYYMSTEKYNNS